jgi:hypothetical protein
LSQTEALQKRFTAALMPNYGVPPVAISRGEGCRVWDPDGREYLDLIAGIAVSSLGHAHPALVEAVTRQVAQVAHTSNLFLHEGEIELAERLLCLLGGNDPPQTPPAPGRAPRERRRTRFLRQLGHRGQRGGDQAGAALPGSRSAGDRGRRARLPRPDHGLAGANR